MDEPVWAQMGFRLVFYVASIAVSLAFFAVVPVGTRWYSAYGSRTMYAYLLHLMVIRSYELCRDGTNLGEFDAAVGEGVGELGGAAGGDEFGVDVG